MNSVAVESKFNRLNGVADKLPPEVKLMSQKMINGNGVVAQDGDGLSREVLTERFHQRPKESDIVCRNAAGDQLIGHEMGIQNIHGGLPLAVCGVPDQGVKLTGQGISNLVIPGEILSENHQDETRETTGKAIGKTVAVSIVPQVEPVKNEHMPYPYFSGFSRGCLVAVILAMIVIKIYQKKQ